MPPIENNEPMTSGYSEVQPTFDQVMVDIECLARGTNPVIVSIAAVKFCTQIGKIGPTFHRFVNLQSCLDHGMVIDADTLNWWLKQSPEVQKELTSKGRVSIREALLGLDVFMAGHWLNPTKPERTKVIWGYPARYDLPILENAFRKCNLGIPWDFGNPTGMETMCASTLRKLYPTCEMPRIGGLIPHNPVDDCILQIHKVLYYLNILNFPTIYPAVG